MWILLALNFSSLGATPAYAATLSVTNTNDSGAGSLRAAIASAGVGDTIIFDPALSGKILRLASTLFFTQDVTIDGSTLAAPITLSGDTDNNGSGNVPVIFVDSDVSVILNSLIITAGTASSGGAIYNDGALVIANSTLSGNTVTGSGYDGYGGGIYNNGILRVTNSTFANNFASNAGGAIANFGMLTMTNSTLSGNAAIDGGGIFNSGAFSFANTIIANSIASSECYNYSGTVTGSHNLVEDGTCLAALRGDPALGTLADNGGSGQTFALLGGSLAIDAGNDAICAADPVNSKSQNGIPRPNGEHCDIGSYEKDITPPEVTAIVRASPERTSASSVIFTVTFSETVNEVDPGDFMVEVTGNISGATIEDVTGTGSARAVLVNTGSGDGTLRLVVPVTAAISDPGDNPLSAVPYTTGQSYSVDKIAPVALSIDRVAHASTAASTVDFMVSFSEPVDSVDPGDFVMNVTGNIAGAVIGDVAGSGSTRTVTVRTGTGSGTLRLDLPQDATITDLTGNALSGLPYAGDQAYTVDKIAPVVLSITRSSPSTTLAPTVHFTITFSEAVDNLGVDDFDLHTTGALRGATIYDLTGSGTRWMVAVDTGQGNGTLGLGMPAAARVTDLVGNPLERLPFTGETYAVLKTATFSDVATSYWSWPWIERLFSAGITGGCSADKYCPDDNVTRAQMAVFIERGLHGSAYVPPTLVGSAGFSDVPATHWSAAWIRQLAAEGITGGCGATSYCPDEPVTRAQVAVFLLRAKYGSSYTPPDAGTSTGFRDVPSNHWAAAWIAQLAAEGITGGCATNLYCPESPVIRAQMAVFLVKTFNLP